MQTLTFTITVEELGILNKALIELPFREVNGLLMRLQGQIDAQVQAANQVAAPAQPTPVVAPAGSAINAPETVETGPIVAKKR